MIKKLSVLLFLFACGFVFAAIQDKSDSTCAAVGNRLIWKSDVQKRMDMRKGSFEEALGELIEENMLGFEAEKEKIEVTPDEISDRISAMEKKIGTKNDFVQFLNASGFLSLSDYERYLKDQMRIEKLIQKYVTGTISVSPEEVSARMSRMPAGKEVLLRRISFGDEKSAADFVEEFRKNPSAAAAKMQVMDWVSLDSVNPDAGKLIRNTEKGSVTSPGLISGKYLVFYVEDERENRQDLKYVRARQEIFQEKYMNQLNQYIQNLKKTVPVKITPSSE